MIPDQRLRTYDVPSAPEPRTCGSCRFYHSLSQLSSHGKCTHPQRRQLIDTVLVRDRELACRDADNGAFWEPCSVSAATTPMLDAVLLKLPGRECRWPKFPALMETIEGTH